MVTTEHLTKPDFEQEVIGLLRIGLRTKVLYKLTETRCIELIKEIIESLDAVRVFDNTSIDAQVCEDIRAKIRHTFYPYDGKTALSHL